MTDPFVDSPPLTDEQRAVVEQPWDARVLVTAGAGSGKTHTLVRRLDALVGHEEEALGAGEILVLSFSQAAVRELRQRISTHGQRARRVRVQTFDSWAYGLLTQAFPDEEWGQYSFDERIRQATAAITKGAVEATELGAPAHVVIDEVQDLVGDRRNMVETLLDRFQNSCGFTVVGDSAQSIYGFQIADLDARAAETDYFFAWLRTSYFDDLVELHLTENFRADSDEARTALPLGPALQQLGSDPDGPDAAGERLHRRLRDLLHGLPDLGELATPFNLDSLKAFPGTCAILTRDNRQALVVSETLFTHGVPHTLKRSLRDRPVPYWVAELLRRTEASTLAEERFRELLADIPLPEDAEVDRLWHALRRAARGPRGFIDVPQVRSLVAEGRFPDDLAASEPSRLVVSTVHRAKGLEFDRVLVVTPPSLSELRKQGLEVDSAAEARTLYVAMTRPREDLYRVACPDSSQVRRHRPTERLYIGGWKPHQRFGIVASEFDISREEPPGAHDPDASAPVVQDYLVRNVRAGDAVVLRRLHDMPMGPDQSPPYTLYHGDQPIGVASEQFCRDLHQVEKVSRNWEISWPLEIDGFRVSALESVAGSVAAGTGARLGGHGLWVVPRLSGIGRYRRDARAEKENQE
ncbi:UvrD-helicase domain-containing protein [Streptomyces sp. NBC_01267]|uniref:UvrD-helicase domain-containing protein n=1 Tax=unclassified Streptomyces TaxID=2593676 RepID=UPI002E30B777|nr:UvrD-helicase domain-containing protein [Streptomyces sp. NBC_01267]